MVQILKAHHIRLLVHQENAIRVQIGVDDALRMEDLHEVNDFDGNVDRLIL